jgi:hypothetical protein
VGWLEPSLNLLWAPFVQRLRLEPQFSGATTLRTLKAILTSGYEVDRTNSPLMVQLGGVLRDIWQKPTIKLAHSLYTLENRLRQHGILVEVVDA